MLQFSEISLDDRERLQPLLAGETDRGCEYTFGNIFIWRKIYNTKVAYLNGGAVIRHDAHGVGYLFPVGQHDLGAAVAEMMADAESEGDEFRIFAAGRDDFLRLDAAFPEMFQFKEERDFAEYIYLGENLRELAGKKYHKKRNHIARFLQERPDYRFCPIDRQNIERVRAMNEAWCERYGCAASDGLREEYCATVEAFDHFFMLGLDGGFIESGGEILAYAMGEPINKETYCVHIEKAYHEIQGSYAIINRDFARRFCGDYRYINREDDVGEEGLRKAKLSYYPEIITDKVTVFKKQ